MDGSTRSSRSSRSSVTPVFPSPGATVGRPRSGAPSAAARLGLAPRRSAAVAKSEAAQSLQRFVRQEYWNGLAAGDVVRVAGHSARGRHWRFRAHVTNTSNGATWVEVALVDGPPPSRRPLPQPVDAAAEPGREGAGTVGRVEKVRSFDPSLVTARWRRKSRAALLSQAASPLSVGPDELAAVEEMAQPSMF